MRLCIVIPTSDSVDYAGVRIRYQRIIDHMTALGWHADIRPIDTFESPADLVADVYLLSKCAKPTALVFAQGARLAGARIGVDLFDDYFSQQADGRFNVRRLWLANMARLSDFAIGSTERMVEVAREAGFSPAHIMRDPGPEVSAATIAEAAARKSAEALETGRLRLAWFGLGDNAHFPVGLQDVAAFADSLKPFRDGDFDCALEIMTNRRALTADALARLRCLPVPYTISEWSEAAERALMARAHVCFLPVNAQPFSVAKSLNRAVTAMSAGAQALTAGYDLYWQLGDFAYGDAATLMADLRAGRARIAAETAEALAERLRALADSATEARKLAAFLDTVVPARPVTGDTPAGLLLHGCIANTDAHKAARRWRMLSVGSPLTSKKLNFDLKLHAEPGDGRLRALLAEPARQLVGPEIEARLTPHGKIGDLIYHEIATDEITPVPLYPGGVGADAAAVYTVTMTACTALLGRLFPGVPLHVAESAILPLPVILGDAPAAAEAAP